MDDPIAVPQSIYRRLITGFNVGLADNIITEHGSTRDLVLVGDPGGEVFAWLWRTDPDQCMMHLADLIASLRVHHPQAPEPLIRLADLIDGFRMSFPQDFSQDEFSAFASAAEARVPGFYGGDPNE